MFIRSISAPVATMLVVLGMTLPAGAGRAQDQAFELGDVLQAIKREIRLAQATETGTPRLAISAVDLELLTSAQKTGSGGLKIMVPTVEVGGTLTGSSEVRHTLSLSLISVEPPEVAATTASLGLVEAIQQAKSALRVALTEPPLFELKQLTYSVRFLLEREAEGRLRFLIFEIPGARVSDTSYNMITFHFTKGPS